MYSIKGNCFRPRMQYTKLYWTLLILHLTCCLGSNIVGSRESNLKYGPSGYVSVANRSDGELEFDTVENELNHHQLRKTNYQNLRRIRKRDYRLKIYGHDSRFKRTWPVVIDSGYVSRVSAADKLARDRTLQARVYGNRGPGKRSTMSHYERFFLPIRMLIKRDPGCRANIRAGTKTVGKPPSALALS